MCDRSLKIISSVLSKSVYTCKHQYIVKNLGKRDGKLIVQGRVHVTRVFHVSSKYQNDINSSIKIPRFLCKTKDKEQIDRYYLAKKLCLLGDFEIAVPKIEKWLSCEEVPASIILILNGLLFSLFEQEKRQILSDKRKLSTSIISKGTDQLTLYS